MPPKRKVDNNETNESSSSSSSSSASSNTVPIKIERLGDTEDKPFTIIDSLSPPSNESTNSSAKKARTSINVDIENFVCPLTLQIMVRPVLASDGHHYEERAILNHLLKKMLVH